MPLVTATTLAGVVGGEGGGSALTVKCADPAPAPEHATRAVPAPPLAERGTFHRHDTAPRFAFLVASFVAAAPGRVMVAVHLFPAGLTSAVTTMLLPAPTLEGETRTRTALLLATAVDAARNKTSPNTPRLSLDGTEASMRDLGTVPRVACVKRHQAVGRTRSTGNASSVGAWRCRADLDDRRPPRAARRLDVDRIADPLAENGRAERR